MSTTNVSSTPYESAEQDGVMALSWLAVMNKLSTL